MIYYTLKIHLLKFRNNIMKKKTALRFCFSMCILLICTMLSSNLLDSNYAVAKIKKAKRTKKAPPKLSKAQRRIKSFEDYLVKAYLTHFKKNRDWLAKCFLVSALGKLDCPQSTNALIKLQKFQKNPVVMIHIWEALHARADTLTRSQHNRWVNRGLKAFRQFKGKCFTGDLRIGLLKAVAGYGPKADLCAKLDFVFFQMLKKIKHTNPADYNTLVAMREILADQRNKKLTKMLISNMHNPELFNKIEFILGGLDSNYKPVGTTTYTPAKDVIINQKRHWLKWVQTAKLNNPKKIKYTLYRGTSNLFPKPIKITNLKKQRRYFRNDLEMKKIRVKSFELTFVIDSTGSMKEVMKWVSRDVKKILTTMELVASEPKLGVTYFRHEIDPKAQTSDCCQKRPLIINGCDAKTKKKLDHTTTYTCKVYTMVSSRGIDTLVKNLQKEKAGGGHNGGAAYGGILAAYKYNKWKKKGKKVMVVIGDTQMTATNPKPKNPGPGSVDSIEPCKKLLKKMKKENFEVHFIRCNNYHQLRNEFSALAKISGGINIHAKFPEPENRNPNNPAPPKPSPQIAPSNKDIGAYAEIVIQIFKSVIPKKHHNKVPPVAAVITEYANGLK